MIRETRSLAPLGAAVMGAALVWASAAMDAHAQARPSRPAPAAEPAKPALVATFGDWGVFATPPGKARTCYSLSQPKQRQPANLNRDPAFIYISHRPADKVRNEVSIIIGFDVKPDRAPKAEIGNDVFDLVAKGGHMWLKNASDEGKFVAALRKGSRLVIKAHSMRNNLTTDTYSLSGVGQALDRALKECP